MYGFFRGLLLSFIHLFFPYKKIHKERAKVERPCVVISNHLSWGDPFMVGSCFKEKMYFLAKKEWFEKGAFLRAVIKTIGGIPVDRQNVDLNAIKECLRTLKSGSKLGIFPEGTRNKTQDELLPLKSGAAMIAVKAKVNFLPMYVYKKSRFLRMNYVFVGNVVPLDAYYGKKHSADDENELVEIMRKAILDTKQECLEYLSNKSKKSK